jgi:ribose 5-phosphate isomerase B
MQHIHIASDHAGFDLKTALVEHLQRLGRQIRDHGTTDAQSCDYPLYAAALCRAVLQDGAPGILVCGTGLGMSVTANRFRGIRAAVCVNEFMAGAARAHNNANVLCLGSRVVGTGLAFSLAERFLDTPFEGGRHQRRIDLLDDAPANGIFGG